VKLRTYAPKDPSSQRALGLFFDTVLPSERKTVHDVDGSRQRIAVVGDVLLASFSGELQGTAASEFEEELVAASSTTARKVLLDLRDVPFIDGAGLALLIDAARRARAQHQHLCVLSSVEVYGTFCGTGLLQAFCNTGLLQAVELVHPCTLELLERLGWLHGTDDGSQPS
jgi:anti-anti-sigma factor